MSKIKEITVFTDGDSSKISTWSNVPYFFTNALINKGIKVNRVNFRRNNTLRKIYNRTFLRVIKYFYPKTVSSFDNSFLNYVLTQYYNKKQIFQYNKSDLYLFMTFSFSGYNYTQKPCAQFCDWTYGYLFDRILGRPADLFEKRAMNRDLKLLNQTDFVFSLFPGAADYIKNSIENKEHVHYIGNVVNSIHKINGIEIIKNRKENKNLLFVGSNHYFQGAQQLVRVFEKIQESNPELELHIIGIGKHRFEELPSNVYCYDYLSKDNESQRDTYYSLLNKANVFINTTPKWGAFSASLEAMYHAIPVIVSPYDEFVLTFGREINFGKYCENGTDEELEQHIQTILKSEQYKEICLNSHNVAKEYTWDLYVDKFLEIIEKDTKEYE